MVWDRAVRAFHWLLVGGIVVAWLSGGSGYRIHEIAGFAIAAAVGFRLIWGFVGSRHARFREFIAKPADVAGYIVAHTRPDLPHHLGHNPAGGYMILALLATITAICVTGAMQLTNRFFGVDWVETAHHLAATALWGLVALHVLGALTASLLHRENLLAAMLDGWKVRRLDDGAPALARVRQRRRIKLDHIAIRAQSRQGVRLLGACLSLGLAYGWIATSGRVASVPADQIAAVAPAPAEQGVAAPRDVDADAEAGASPPTIPTPSLLSAQPPIVATMAVAPAADVGAAQQKLQQSAAAEKTKRGRKASAKSKAQRTATSERNGRTHAQKKQPPAVPETVQATIMAPPTPRFGVPGSIPPPPYALGAPMPK